MKCTLHNTHISHHTTVQLVQAFLFLCSRLPSLSPSGSLWLVRRHFVQIVNSLTFCLNSVPPLLRLGMFMLMLMCFRSLAGALSLSAPGPRSSAQTLMCARSHESFWHSQCAPAMNSTRNHFSFIHRIRDCQAIRISQRAQTHALRSATIARTHRRPHEAFELSRENSSVLFCSRSLTQCTLK